jgi:uncharacterized membrane protein (UPF0127 family)
VTARRARVVCVRDGSELACDAEVATSFLARGIGLLGRSGLGPGEGLVIVGTNSVHSLGMRFDIDVVHLDRQGRVLRTLTPLRRGAIGPVVRGGHTVVELPAGTVARTGVAVGDTVRIEPSPN